MILTRAQIPKFLISIGSEGSSMLPELLRLLNKQKGVSICS